MACGSASSATCAGSRSAPQAVLHVRRLKRGHAVDPPAPSCIISSWLATSTRTLKRTIRNLGTVLQHARNAGHSDWSAIEDRTRSTNGRWLGLAGQMIAASADQYREDLVETRDLPKFPSSEFPHMPGSSTTPRLCGRSLSRAHTCCLPHSQWAICSPDNNFYEAQWLAVRPSTDASPPPSRATAHGSRPMSEATPSSYRPCTDYSLPVSRRTANILARAVAITHSLLAFL